MNSAEKIQKMLATAIVAIAVASPNAHAEPRGCSAEQSRVDRLYESCERSCERGVIPAGIDSCLADCAASRASARVRLVESKGCAPIAQDPGSEGGASSETTRGTVETPGGPLEADLELVDGMALFEGDIVVAPAEEAGAESGQPSNIESVARRSRFWRNSVVSYAIDPALPNQSRVRDAIAHIEARTNVRFVPRVWESAFVTFTRTADPKICGASPVGQTGSQQTLVLNDGCGMGVVVHELLHALGFWHEQSRTDRNKRITIHVENIDPNYVSNFKTYTESGDDGQDIGKFDFNSVMLYGPYSFSQNGLPTITRKNGGLYTAQRDGLSTRDTKGVNRIYRSVPLYIDAHVQDIGEGLYYGNELVGTRGQALRLEGFSIGLGSFTPGLTLEYMAHIQDIGDTAWVGEGQFVGTRGESRRLEGFAIRLKGPQASKYKVSYMAHIQDIGDTPFVANGAFCGTRGEGLRVEGITVRVERR